MSEREKYGKLCSLPTTCGTCSTVFNWVCLRWCASCGEAICPSCYPAAQDEPLGQCRRCIEEGRPKALYLACFAAGRARAEEFERRFWEAFLGRREGAGRLPPEERAHVEQLGGGSAQAGLRALVAASMARTAK
jgi:hypothetical protein